MKKLIIYSLFVQFFTACASNIHISLIKPDQYAQAERVIVETQLEVWQLPYTYEEAINSYGFHLVDLDDVQHIYLDNDGTFLVIVDDDTVVGTGAIKKYALMSLLQKNSQLL